MIWWDEEKKAWTGYDEPDCQKPKPPSYRAKPESQGLDTISGDDPFVLQPDGKGWLFAPNGLQEGPMPTHYEPFESPVENALYGQQCNPGRLEYNRSDNKVARPYADPLFPYVITTYRLTEHHTSGAMSRWLTWLNELQPQMFCEISQELASEKGLNNGDWATIATARAEIEARVLVTQRMKPLKMGRRWIHQIGLPYHWGNRGLIVGDSANELLAFGADPNTSIMESKAITGDIRAGRREKNKHHWMRPGIAPDEELRDLPQARSRPIGKHHITSPLSKQGPQT